MIVSHTAIRQFMLPGCPEPNEYYRPWLEQNVGKQSVDWDWYIHSAVNNNLAIDFADKEKALLFELVWP